MAKKKTENIKAAPVLRAGNGGGEQPTPTPEQTGTRTYQIMDPWKDRGAVNLVDVKAVDGEITEVKVNGEPAGGGGNFTSANASIVLNDVASLEISGLAYVDPTNDEFYTGDPQINSNRTLTVVLYNGGSPWFTMAGFHDAEIVISGDIIENEGSYQITGNCTITVNRR